MGKKKSVKPITENIIIKELKRQQQWLLKWGYRFYTRPIKPALDNRIDTIFNRKSLSKYNVRMLNDDNLQEPDAIRNEVVLMMLGEDLPKLRDEKQMKKMFNIRSNNIFRVLYDVFHTLFVDIKEVKRTGTLEGTALTEKANYVISRGIAQKYGHDKLINRIKSEKKAKAATAVKLRNAAVITGLEYDKTSAYRFEDENTGQIIEDIRDDRGWQRNQDRLENIELVNQLRSMMQPADLKTWKIYYLAMEHHASLEVEFRKQENECKKLGINSPAALRKRMERLRESPSIKQIGVIL
jgi:hypothetical protein